MSSSLYKISIYDSTSETISGGFESKKVEDVFQGKVKQNIFR